MTERNAKLDDPATREQIRAHVAGVMRTQRTGDDPARVQLAFCRFDTSLNGLNLAEILQRNDIAVSIDTAADLVLDLQRQGGCTAVYHAMSENDVAALLADDAAMVASDGGVIVPGFEMPHPRNYGSFARVLGRYVRGEQPPYAGGSHLEDGRVSCPSVSVSTIAVG